MVTLPIRIHITIELIAMHIACYRLTLHRLAANYRHFAIVSDNRPSVSPLYRRERGHTTNGISVLEYAEEKPWDDLEIRVFPGADGTFTLYEDEGDNYNYENGVYTEIPMSWNEHTRQFTLGARKGQYPNMSDRRKFRITLPDGSLRAVDYEGKKMTVKF